MHRTLVRIALTLVGSLAACAPAHRPDGGAGLIPKGSLVPDLVGTDQSGKIRRISDERGHPLVVYFYPKDGTPGCTREACAFRDVWQRYQTAGVQVFAISADGQEAHAAFAQEHHLPFPLIADPTHAWATAFGVSTTLGMDARVSFLIDPSGKVARVYPKVDPGVHATEVLEDAASLLHAASTP